MTARPPAKAKPVSIKRNVPKGVATMDPEEAAQKRSIGSEMVAKRYAKMTPEERSAAAKNAAVKRWAEVKKKATAGKKSAKKRK